MLVAAGTGASCTRASPSKGGHSRVASKGNGPAGSKNGGDLRPDQTSDTVVLGGSCAMCVQKSRGDARVCVWALGAAECVRRAMTITGARKRRRF